MTNLSANPAIHIRKRKYLYTIKEKQAILKEQNQSKESNLSIARKYNVNESSVRKWRKTIDVDITMDENIKQLTY